MRALRTTARLALLSCVPLACGAAALGVERWSHSDLEVLRDLWIGSLGPVPVDPSNRHADDSLASALGHRIFFDERLSANGRVSCATCHDPEREFQDGVPLARGIGTTSRRTMPIAGTAYAPFLFWDGRKDSQWAQALGPLENPQEHGTTRAAVALRVAEHHRAEYERVFGPLPDLRGVPGKASPSGDSVAVVAWAAMGQAQRDAVTGMFVNVGKAIAAYERRIRYGPSRFDQYVEGLLRTRTAPRGVLSFEEVAGLRLFIGKANCTQCHSGPLLTNHEFHNTGVPAVPGLPPDAGRSSGALEVLRDEFNCRSRWSDAKASQCDELAYLKTDGHELQRAYKVPSLRNVASRAPFMHAGQFRSLGEVLRHYNRAPTAPAGHTELVPLRLSTRELQQLEAYLRSLHGGTDAPATLLRPLAEPAHVDRAARSTRAAHAPSR